MGVYKHDKNKDKKAGDGLALSEWNDLRNAVAGHSGLGLALTESDNVGIGIDTPDAKLHVEGDTLVHGQLLIGEASKVKQAKLKFEDAYPEEGAKRESAIMLLLTTVRQIMLGSASIHARAQHIIWKYRCRRKGRITSF